MDANNILTNRDYGVEEWKAINGVMLIGRRGSTCISMNDSNSDIDYLVVGDNSDEMVKQENVMLDTNLVTLNRFEHMLQRMSIETIEALYNIEYMSDSFTKSVEKYRDYVSSGNDVRFLFWYQVWLMLKNQLKQFYKSENKNKFASKIYLYSRLLEDDDILDYWVSGKIINDEIRENYFRIRGGNLNDDDFKFIEKVAANRNDSINRETYRARYNSAMSVFKGFQNS